MNTRKLAVATILTLSSLTLGVEAFARSGNGQKMQGRNAANISQTRPEGSQRRDGTFLTTGVTANGSTTRQGKGTGLQNGTCTTPGALPAVTSAAP